MSLHPDLIAATEELHTVHELFQSGDFPGAVAVCDQILDIFERHGLKVGPMPARVHQARGAALLEHGDASAAMEALGRGVSCLGWPGGELDDPETKGALLGTTGHALRTLGRYKAAREAYEMAIPLLGENPGDGLVSAINSLGALVSHLGDVPRALAIYEEAWEAMQGADVTASQRGAVLLNLGSARCDVGDFQVSLSQLEEALDLFRYSGNRANEAQALLSLSGLYSKAGDLVQARTMAEGAVAAARGAVEGSELYARCLYRRETAAAALGEQSHALIPGLRECVETVSAVAPQGRDAYEMRTSLAAHLLADGQIEDGISVAEEGVKAAEALRAEAGSGLGRQQVADTSAMAYDTLVFALLFATSPTRREQLVEALEHRRGRWLLDTLGNPEEVEELDAEHVQRLRSLRAEARRARQRVHRARRQLAAGHPPEGGVDVKALERIELGARHQIEAIDAQLGGDGTSSAVLSCAEIQARLGPQQAILHCYITPMESAVVTLTASDLRVRELSIGEPWMAEAIKRLSKAASAGKAIDEPTLRILSEQLLADLSDESSELIVICDGPLHRLPWAILSDIHRAGEPLGMTRSISHAVSATGYLALTGRTHPAPERDLLLVGDPAYTPQQFPDARDRGLAGTARELAAIAALYPDHTLLTGTAATEARVVEELVRHRRAHFACHGAGDDQSAAFGGLVLAPPGPADEALLKNTDDTLEAWEIEDLSIPCETVVLASCSTAGGEILRGEGLVGLAHAFHRAGAREVSRPFGRSTTPRLHGS
jgi:CHAT domain-containing protein/tetratricopeptide (TPR) repeat protein